MSTNVQRIIEEQRRLYGKLEKPLLQYLAEIHGISIRQFAEIFGISNGHAENLLKHRVLPSLELAFQIARYYDCAVDELFGWRVDDTGSRSPRVIEIEQGEELVRIRMGHADRNALPRVQALITEIESGRLC